MFQIIFLVVNGKNKYRKSLKINVGFPTFFISDTINIEVIVQLNKKDEVELRNKMKNVERKNLKLIIKSLMKFFEDEKKYLVPLPNKNILERYKQPH